MRRANCHACKTPITLANTRMLTDFVLIWDCKCGTITHRNPDPEVIEAVIAPFHPRLPYVAAPCPPIPLDDDAEAVVLLFGLHVASHVNDLQDFIRETTPGGKKVTPPDGA